MRDSARSVHMRDEGVQLPPAVHECPRPDRDRIVPVEPGSDLALFTTHRIEIVYASYPLGSRWRCPECCALWVVVDPSTPLVRCFYREWRKLNTGFWYRIFHRKRSCHDETATPEA